MPLHMCGFLRIGEGVFALQLWSATGDVRDCWRDFLAYEGFELRIKLVAEAAAALHLGRKRSCTAAHKRIEDGFAPEAVHFDEAAREFDGEHRDMTILALRRYVIPHAPEPGEPLLLSEAALFFGLGIGSWPSPWLSEKQNVLMLICDMSISWVVHGTHEHAAT